MTNFKCLGIDFTLCVDKIYQYVFLQQLVSYSGPIERLQEELMLLLTTVLQTATNSHSTQPFNVYMMTLK